MSMRSNGATHNLFAISAASMESAINTEQTIDLTLLTDIGDVINVTPRRESNEDEANGLEEASVVYDNGYLVDASINHKRAQPQHFAYLFAYGLGSCETVAAGSGYQHTITGISRGIDRQRELPSFTALARFGDMITKRHLCSMFVDQVVATFAKDSWVTLAATLKGTGKYEDSVEEVSVTAAGNVTELTLPVGVQGATQELRTQNVHRIRVELDTGVWTEVEGIVAHASDATLVTITAPSVETSDFTYKVLYAPIEAAKYTFPAKVAESPLRVSEMTLYLGGKWNGSAFVGGRAIGSEIQNVSYTLSNSSQVSFVPGGGGDYASDHAKSRTQVIALSRKFRDMILQQHVKDNDTFALKITCTGAEFDTGHNYSVELIFPLLAVASAPISVGDKKLAEAGDLKVLEDATYGSSIIVVKNTWTAYAQ